MKTLISGCEKCIKHNNFRKFKRSMENLTLLLVDPFQRINVDFTIATTVIIVGRFDSSTYNFGSCTGHVHKFEKAFAKLRRIKIENDTQDKIDCNTKITQGKFLLALIILEYLCIFPSCIGDLYPQFHHISPIFDRPSLPFNSTCIITISCYVCLSEYR